MPKHLHLTLQHRAGVSLYTSFFKLAKTCVFIKQSFLLLYCKQHIWNMFSQSFFLSYRANLPSSFNVLILNVCVYSTCSPVSVYSTVLIYIYKLFPEDIIKIKQSLNFILFYTMSFILYSHQPNALAICFRDRLNILRLLLK